MLVEVGLSHERPSEAWAPQSPPLILVKFYTSIQRQKKTSKKAKTNNSYLTFSDVLFQL